MPDPVRVAAGLPIGRDGEFCVVPDALVPRGTYRLLEAGEPGTVLDDGRPPGDQPSLQCKWAPSADGRRVEWDGREKFYGYVGWIAYLGERLLEPWGYVLHGEVSWRGDDPEDEGLIIIDRNAMTVIRGTEDEDGVGTAGRDPKVPSAGVRGSHAPAGAVTPPRARLAKGDAGDAAEGVDHERILGFVRRQIGDAADAMRGPELLGGFVALCGSVPAMRDALVARGKRSAAAWADEEVVAVFFGTPDTLRWARRTMRSLSARGIRGVRP